MLKYVLKLLITLGLFVVLVAVTLWAVLLFYHDAIRLKAEKVIDRQVDAEVTFDDLSLTLLTDFPNPTVTLHNLLVMGKEEFSGDTLVVARELDLEIKAFSYFFGETELKSLHLKSPRLSLEVLKNGHSNYNIFPADSLKAPASAGDSSYINIALDEIRISDGIIEYRDRSSDTYALMQGLDHSGKGDFAKDIFDFKTENTIREFTLDYGRVRFFSRKEVAINMIVEMNFRKNTFTLKENDLRINHFRFDLDGSLGVLPKGVDLNLNFATQETDFKNIISLVPGVYMTDFKQITTKGQLAFNGFISGQYLPDEGKLPSLLANIRVTDGLFKIDTLPDPIENIRMDLEIRNLSGIRDSTLINLKNFQFDMRHHLVRGRIKVQGLDHMIVDTDILADLDLAELELMYPIAGVELKGKANFELKAKGPLEYERGAPGRIPSFHLNLKLTDGKFKYDHLPAAVDSIQFHLVADNLTGDLEKTVFDFRGVHLDMGKNIVHGYAKLEGYRNLKIKTDIRAEMDLADIEKLFPVSGLVMRGNLSLDMKADGTYNHEKKQFPSVDTRVELSNGFLQTADYPEPLENVHLSGEVVNATGNYADTRVSINRLTYTLEGEPFEVRGTIANLETYKYDLKIKGLVDLEKLAKIYPVEGLRLEGIIISDVEINGTLADLEAGLYDRTFSNGQVEVKDLVVQSPSIRKGIGVSDALFTLSPSKIVLVRFKGKMGRSQISMSGDLFNYMSFLTRNKDVIRGDLDVKCDTLDMNEWLGEQKPPATGTPPPNQINVWQVPANVELVLDTEIDYVLYEDMKISKFDGEVRIKDGVLHLRETGFNSLNAQFSFTGDYDTRDIQHPKIDVDLDIKELDIARAYKEMELVRTLLPAAGDAEGSFSIVYKLKGELAQDLSPKLETLAGEGTMRIANAKINGMKIFEELSKASKKHEVNDPHLKDFVMRSEIRDNKIYVKPFSIKVSGFDADVEGVSDMNGTLRYLVKLELPPVGIKVPFHVTGTYDNPKVAIGKGHVLTPGDSILNR